MSGFDWVKARTECTPERVFESLADAVQQDLERHGKLNPGLAQSQSLKVCNDDLFYVERSGVHRIVFERTKQRIIVKRWSRDGQPTPILSLVVKLGESGDCILIDDEGKALKPWQVRRIALEDTLFNNDGAGKT